MTPTKNRFSQNRSRRVRLAALLALLALPLLACGLTNPLFARRNAVRLAVYEYERAARGPMDELLIFFRRDEPRVRFAGQYEQGGRSVWLDPYGQREYFAKLAPQSTYLYIQKIEFSDDNTQATAEIYRGANNQYQGRQLTLTANDIGWQVTAESPLPNEEP
jgi:hypothetical protein